MDKNIRSLTGGAEVGNAMAVFDQVIQGSMQDKIPSVMSSTLSLRPDIFSAVMAAGKPIMFEGEIPASVKQMMVLIVARQRQCAFCSDVHKAVLEAMGIDDALIESCVDDPEMKLVPPMHRQILEFAANAAENPGDVEDEQFERLRDSGLSEAEILEIAMVASFANFLVTWTDVPAKFMD